MNELVEKINKLNDEISDFVTDYGDPDFIEICGVWHQIIKVTEANDSDVLIPYSPEIEFFILLQSIPGLHESKIAASKSYIENLIKKFEAYIKEWRGDELLNEN